MRAFRATGLVGFGLSLVLGLSCSKNSPPAAAPDALVAARRNISDSIAVLQDKDDRPLIFINKAALEKEFLLQGSMMKQPVVAWSEGVKSRIVAFRKFQGRLYMLEATQGHTVAPDIQQTLPLFSFAIKEERPDGLVFDLSQGLDRIYNNKEWRTSDRSGRDYQQEFHFIPISNSFIEKAEIIGNALVFRQVGSGTNETGPLAVKYYLTPYHPDPTFVPTVSGDFERVGFFEAAPYLMPGGATMVRAAKYHHGKPIIFSISANTPPEYRQAIREGLLYWNKAFNSTVIQVDEAPAGITAPDFTRNMVQWVTWDNAPYAYADVNLDPRTGQVLHAQIYLPSQFAISTKQAAQRLLNRGRVRSGAPAAHLHEHDHRAEIPGEHLCAGMSAEARADSLSSLIAANPTDAAVLRASQDNIRELAAHEGGHTLGLRHDFAANVHAQNYPLANRPAMFSEYLQGRPPAEDVLPTSAVMDYSGFEEASFVGNRISRGLPAFAHDRQAIQALYYGVAPGDELIYCTDPDVDKWMDCVKHDSGKSAIEHASLILRERMDNLHHVLLTSYVAARHPAPGARPTPVERLSIDPVKVVTHVLTTQNETLKALFGLPEFLVIRRQFPFVNSTNSGRYEDARWDYMIAEFNRVGGVEGIKKAFPIPSIDKVKRSSERFQEVIAPERGEWLTGPLGQAFAFSAGELVTIRRNTDTIYQRLPDLLAAADQADWILATNAWKHADWRMAPLLAAAMKERVETYLLSTSDRFVEAIVTLTPPGATGPASFQFKLPVFAYHPAIRRGSLRLLAPGTSAASAGFGRAERTAIRTQFETLATNALDGLDLTSLAGAAITVRTLDDRADPALTSAVAQWLDENIGLYNDL